MPVGGGELMATKQRPGAPPRWHVVPGLFKVDNPDWIRWRFGEFTGSRRRLPDGTRRFVISRDGYVCGICGDDVAPDDVEIDHIVPVVHGGRDDTSNLQVTHSLCNRKKGSGGR